MTKGVTVSGVTGVTVSTVRLSLLLLLDITQLLHNANKHVSERVCINFLSLFVTCYYLEIIQKLAKYLAPDTQCICARVSGLFSLLGYHVLKLPLL